MPAPRTKNTDPPPGLAPPSVRRTDIGSIEETDKLESGVRPTSLRYRSYVRGPNLVLAEVLLALIATNQARAEVTRAAPELPPTSPREVRQLDFRELLVRSLSYTPPSRLQSAARGTTARAAMYPRGGPSDQRAMQALLLRPVVENPASRFVNARAELRGGTGTGFMRGPASPRTGGTVAQPPAAPKTFGSMGTLKPV